MKIREYLGKKVDVNKLKSCADNFSLPEELEKDENPYFKDGQFTKAEIFLREFEFEGSYDNTGHNFYSLKVVVDGDKIVKLIRVAHCHMCNNEGSDDELTRFPYNSLEIEADEYLTHCLLAS